MRLDRTIAALAAVVLVACAAPSARAQGGPPPIEWVAGGHIGVGAVDISPDGTLLASGSIADNTIKLWDIATGRFIRTLAAHYESIHGVAFSPDGQYLASAAGTAFGSGDVNVKIWNVVDGAVVRTFGPPDTADAWGVAFSPDQTLLAVGRGYDIQIYSVATGALVRTLTGHTWFVFGLDFSADGTLLASASGDDTARIWRVSDGAPIHTLSSHTFFVSGVAFAGGGKLVTSSWDMTLKTWDPGSGALIRTLTGHSDAVNGVDWVGGPVASCDAVGVIKLWDAGSGANIGTIVDPAVVSALEAMRFVPDGMSIVAGGADGHSRRYDIGTHARLTTYGHHAGSVHGIAFTTDGKVVSGAGDFLGKVFRASDGQFLFDLVGHDDVVNAVTVTPDNLVVATAAGSHPPDTRDPTIKLWSLADGSLIRTLPGHPRGSYCAAFSPDGSLLASGGGDNLVKLWRPSDGSVAGTLTHAFPVETLAWTPDGATIVTGGASTLSWWDVAGRSLVRSVPTPWAVETLAMSRDGQLLAVTLQAYGDNVLIVRVSDGAIVRTLTGHVDYPHGVAFSADGTEILSGSGYDYDIKRWRVADGSLLSHWDRECGWGQFLSLPIVVSPDGRHFAYGRGDATLVMAGYPGAVETDCANAADDDGDTLVDCADPDCLGDPACAETNCTNLSDDDGDTLVDCADPDCAGDPTCVETDCTNGVDDDADTLMDCFDSDCAGEPTCVETDCTNEFDDDGDTLTDCADPDCARAPTCPETECDDGIDQDGDTLIDCADSDCIDYPECDRDGDGVINGNDCGPTDPGAWAVPGEVALLLVSKPAGLPFGTADLSWTDAAPVAGPGVRYDVVSGVIRELWSDRGFARAACLAMDASTEATRDGRALPGSSDGFWHLVRAQNSCGAGEWGTGTLGPRSLDATLCE